jgi:hypothetical protein
MKMSVNQIKMWIIPQKAEHNDSYNINLGYFELLVKQALRDLLQKVTLNHLIVMKQNMARDRCTLLLRRELGIWKKM